MKYKTAVFGFIGILFLFSSSVMVVHSDNPDTTKIGVGSGDSFIFILEKYLPLQPHMQEGYSLTKNYDNLDNIYLQAGDEVVLVIPDDFNNQISNDEDVKEVTWIIGNQTYQSKVDLGNYFGRGYIIYTDWEFWENQIKLELNYILTEEYSKDNIENSYSIVNGKSEFVVELNMSNNRPGIGSGYQLMQWIWEKKNGVLFYEHWVETFTMYGDESHDSSTELYESLFMRKGYTFHMSEDNSDSPNILMGFEIELAILSILPFVIIKSKRKRK